MKTQQGEIVRRFIRVFGKSQWCPARLGQEAMMCAQNEYPQSQSCWARMKQANHPDDIRDDYFFLRRRPKS